MYMYQVMYYGYLFENIVVVWYSSTLVPVEMITCMGKRALQIVRRIFPVSFMFYYNHALHQLLQLFDEGWPLVSENHGNSRWSQ